MERQQRPLRLGRGLGLQCGQSGHDFIRTENEYTKTLRKGEKVVVPVYNRLDLCSIDSATRQRVRDIFVTFGKGELDEFLSNRGITFAFLHGTRQVRIFLLDKTDTQN